MSLLKEEATLPATMPPKILVSSPSTGTSTTPLVLGPHDVLLGRGSGSNDHPGNRLFRDYVQRHKATYNATSNRTQKVQIAQTVVQQVYAQGGRFVKLVQSSSGGDAGVESYWVQVTDTATIMEKAKQALRQIPSSRDGTRQKRGSFENGDVPQRQSSNEQQPAKKTTCVIPARTNVAKRPDPPNHQGTMTMKNKRLCTNTVKSRSVEEIMSQALIDSRNLSDPTDVLLSTQLMQAAQKRTTLNHSASYCDCCGPTKREQMMSRSVNDNSQKIKYVSSPIYQALVQAYSTPAAHLGATNTVSNYLPAAAVVYGASGIGKTMGGQAFLQCEMNRQPALMFTGRRHCPESSSYASFLAHCCCSGSNSNWLASLLAMLQQQSNMLLILDDVEDEADVEWIQALRRTIQLASSGPTTRLVVLTRKVQVADHLCSHSSGADGQLVWQPLAPRTPGSGGTPKRWEPYVWTPHMLTMVVIAQYPELLLLLPEEEKKLPFSWLTEGILPWTALAIAQSVVTANKKDEIDSLQFLSVQHQHHM